MQYFLPGNCYPNSQSHDRLDCLTWKKCVKYNDNTTTTTTAIITTTTTTTNTNTTNSTDNNDTYRIYLFIRVLCNLSIAPFRLFG